MGSYLTDGTIDETYDEDPLSDEYDIINTARVIQPPTPPRPQVSSSSSPPRTSFSAGNPLAPFRRSNELTRAGGPSDLTNLLGVFAAPGREISSGDVRRRIQPRQVPRPSRPRQDIGAPAEIRRRLPRTSRGRSHSPAVPVPVPRHSRRRPPSAAASAAEPTLHGVPLVVLDDDSDDDVIIIEDDQPSRPRPPPSLAAAIQFAQRQRHVGMMPRQRGRGRGRVRGRARGRRRRITTPSMISQDDVVKIEEAELVIKTEFPQALLDGLRRNQERRRSSSSSSSSSGVTVGPPRPPQLTRNVNFVPHRQHRSIPSSVTRREYRLTVRQGRVTTRDAEFFGFVQDSAPSFRSVVFHDIHSLEFRPRSEEITAFFSNGENKKNLLKFQCVAISGIAELAMDAKTRDLFVPGSTGVVDPGRFTPHHTVEVYFGDRVAPGWIKHFVEFVNVSKPLLFLELPKGIDPAFSLSDHDFRVARDPTARLNDNIVDFYVSYLLTSVFQTRKAYAFTTSNWATIRKDVDRAARRVPRFVVSVDDSVGDMKSNRVMDKDFLFFPIVEGEHWMLTVVLRPGLAARGLKGGSILFLDSLRMSNGHSLTLPIRNYLARRWIVEEGQMASLGAARLQDALGLPLRTWRLDIQRNGRDCGVFLIAFLEKILQMGPDEVQRKINAGLPEETWFTASRIMALRNEIHQVMLSMRSRQTFRKIFIPESLPYSYPPRRVSSLAVTTEGESDDSEMELDKKKKGPP